MAFLKSLFGKFKKRGDEEATESKIEFSTEKSNEFYDKDITENEIILFIVTYKSYQAELVRIAKSVSKRFRRIVYISLNKPAEKIVKILKENKVDTKKILFIDGVTKSVKADAANHGIIFIHSPDNIKEFEAELDEILEKEKLECLVYDSLSAMAIYDNHTEVIKFVHDLITRLMTTHTNAEFICLSDNINSPCVRYVSTLADKVIDLSKEKAEMPDAGFHRKEAIAKSESEIDALKKAYESEFISEESYLKAKARVEEKLRRLRKIDIQVLQAEGFVRQS